jgi:hypothetical protein
MRCQKPGALFGRVIDVFGNAASDDHARIPAPDRPAEAARAPA